MYILGKNTKKTMHKSYTKEYNIIAIFSLTIAITISLSFIIGSVIIYSYLNKLDNPSLFIQLISNEKLVYSSALSAFLILIFILVYSIFPSIYFVHQYGKKNKQ